MTRKITRGACRILFGLDSAIYLGNLDAKRDWGHAKDYVEGMYLILQQNEPDDYVLATGRTNSIRDFVVMTFKKLGMNIAFLGKGVDEVGIVDEVDHNAVIRVANKIQIANEHSAIVEKTIKSLKGKAVIKVDARYFRPSEVDILLRDATKAKQKLGWEPRHTLDDLIEDMVESDMEAAYRDFLLNRSGFAINASCGM